MKESVKISNEMKITDILPDGFAMIKSDDESILPDYFIFRTKELVNKDFYEKKEVVNISIEYVEQYGIDKIGEEIILYAVVNQLCSGGMHLKYLKYFNDKEESRWHKEFFYKDKGLITLPKLRIGNPFEIGDFVLIQILKRWKTKN